MGSGRTHPLQRCGLERIVFQNFEGLDRRGSPLGDALFPDLGEGRELDRVNRDRSKAGLDQFIAALGSVAEAVRIGATCPS